MAGPDRVEPGETGHFEVAIRNFGPHVAYFPRILIDSNVPPSQLSARIRAVAACSAAVATANGSQVLCSLANLSGSPSTIQFIDFDIDSTGISSTGQVTYTVRALTESTDPRSEERRVGKGWKTRGAAYV